MAIPLLIVAAMTVATLPPASLWAGDRMILTLTAAGAQLQGDCSEGSIIGAVKPDAAGRFTGQGRFDEHRGGPQHVDETVSGPASPPHARYRGRIDGETMQLNISVAGQPERRLVLKKDARIKLVRCY